MAKHAHKELTLDDKTRFTKCRDSTNATHRDLADQFGIGKTTVSDILRRKDDYIAQNDVSLPKDRKRKDRKTDVSEVV
jgi:IS30 family transposase